MQDPEKTNGNDNRLSSETISHDWGKVFKLLVESTTDYAIFTMDINRLVQTWNKGAERILGYAKEEIIGQSGDIIFTAEDKAKGEPQKEAEAALTEGCAEDDRWHVRKDGSQFFATGVMQLLADSELKIFAKILRDKTKERRAEESIKESEERLQKALSIETVGVIYFNAEGAFTDTNEAFLKMSGFTREVMTSGELSWEDLTPPEWIEPSLQALEELKSAGRTTPYEKEYFRKDGSRFWALFAASRINENESVEYVIDITDRKLLEEQVKSQFEELENVYRTAPVGLALIDKDFHYVHINERLAEINGISVEKHIGRTVREIVPQFADQAEHIFRQILETGEPLLNVEFEGETPAQPGVRRFWNQNWIPLKNAAGEAIAISVSVAETTLHKLAEEALRESEERFRAIFNQATAGIAQTDLTGRFLLVNEELFVVTGYTREELLEMKMQDITHPDDLPGNLELFNRAITEGVPFEIEKRYIRKDDEIVWVNVSVSAVLDAENKPQSVIGVMVDISERKRIEEELHRTNNELEHRVKERTNALLQSNLSLADEIEVRKVAEAQIRELLRKQVNLQENERRRIAREIHDQLGQEMTALRLKLSSLKPENKEPELIKQIEEADKMAEQIDASIDYLAWEMRPPALDELGLEAALSNFTQFWSDYSGVKAEFHNAVKKEQRFSNEIETNLYRILQEALQNVQKHAGADTVSILLTERDNHLELIIEDNGKGYDAEREVSLDTNKGMGVINMRERATLVGGGLEIESAPNKGTTIFVRVPKRIN